MPLLTKTQHKNAEQHHIRKRQERAQGEITRQALGVVSVNHFRRPVDNTRGHVFPIFQGFRNEVKNEIMRQALDFVNMTHFGMRQSGRRGLSTFPTTHGSKNAFFEVREEILRQIDDATDNIGALRARRRNHSRAEPDDPTSDEWWAWAVSAPADEEEEEAEWVQLCRSLYEEMSNLDDFFVRTQAELFAARRIDL